MRWISGWLRRFFTRGRYRVTPKEQPTVRLSGEKARRWWQPKRPTLFDEIPESFREPRLAYISRHGLLQAGLTCPLCGQKAADPGEFQKIQMSSKGEYVPCLSCGTALLASPDDDVDPVTPDSTYDPAIYHVFRRSTVDASKYPRITDDEPQVENWVVLVGCEHEGRNLDGAEGRILRLFESEDGCRMCEIALAGNTGIGGTREIGADIVEVPLRHAFCMVQSSLRLLDPVKFIRGPHMGLLGTLIESRLRESGTVQVQVPDHGLITCPIEYIEKYYPRERLVPPAPTPDRFSTPKDASHV